MGDGLAVYMYLAPTNSNIKPPRFNRPSTKKLPVIPYSINVEVSAASPLVS